MASSRYPTGPTQPSVRPRFAPGVFFAHGAWRHARALGCVVLFAAAVEARGAEVDLGVGADVWTAGNVSGIFSFNAGFLFGVVPSFELGLRTGVFIVTPGSLGTTTGGIPLDLELRGLIRNLYIEGVVGPWFFFAGPAVRAHVGLGFGWRGGPLRFGAEVAYLTDGAQFGLRFAFAF